MYSVFGKEYQTLSTVKHSVQNFFNCPELCVRLWTQNFHTVPKYIEHIK